jgi:hypothetical protein
MDPLQQNVQQPNTQRATIPVDDMYQNLEVGFIRKRDGELIFAKLGDLFRQFKTADFINNEIVLSGEVCQLNSFQKKPDPATLTVNWNLNGGTGSYSVNGTQYTANHDFTVNKGTAVVITITPDSNSTVDSVIDSNGVGYQLNNGAVTVTVNANLTLNVTIKAKII